MIIITSIGMFLTVTTSFTLFTLVISDAARELISREFSRILGDEILENEFSILEKLIFQKYVVLCHFEDIQSEIIL